ncbi:MAG TPA: chromate resistance protein ChrB domain-containing protein, partial [Vicinamibacterales bacterium]|nr:chromate resistance protein ChrB domain-containing protein [Vicinamibacterales bacterium]
MTKSPQAAAAPAAAPAARPARRWLLLVHQLPAAPSNLRVKTWRRLQELGALPVKQSVYVLPDTPESREDFEWLRVEIEGSGGEAVIFSADHVATDAESELVEDFRRSRQSAYTDLAADLQQVTSRARGPIRPRKLSRFRERLQAIERIDFFGSAGRDRVASLLAALESKAPGARLPRAGADDHTEYQNRVWVTRPRPGVDRMSSAWLIRRFIDPGATFAFITDVKHAPRGAVPFDMYGAGIGHDGDLCTFE